MRQLLVSGIRSSAREPEKGATRGVSIFSVICRRHPDPTRPEWARVRTRMLGGTTPATSAAGGVHCGGADTRQRRHVGGVAITTAAEIPCSVHDRAVPKLWCGDAL